ncbi:connectin-like [Cydia pomonella]|uniref:connectin-like n=1 Tax=Cydia pomonella TaxID=82600 RepID=UPI002ADDB565|nr:connectin-like [Cydia pomonella]XP_061717748.1 connectin-like [Cydia pomonella]
MEQIIKHLVIMAALTIAQPAITAKDDHKIEFYHIPVFTNICDIVDRRSLVHCYCDSTKPKMATRADCWIFTGGITPEDPIWPNFSSQSELEHLMFNVRSDEALTFIPAKAIVRLERLKHISIQFGTIQSVPPYAFTNSSTIRQISLRSNKISILERHSFAQMMMLSNLSLDDNQITELRRDVFFGLPNLHVLHLSNNNLSLIHEGCFKHLNNLIELKLDLNSISVVTREMFEGLENLSRLNLRSNRLTMIGNLAFSELWGLKDLMLDNNAIEYVSERAFGGLTQLRKLTLSGNKLTAFYEDILEDIRSLIVLDMRDNLLESMSYETIRPVVENGKSASRAVYLDGNPLRCDCRLSWIYLLRNETKDNTLKHALEKISCVSDTEKRPEKSNEIEENTLADENYGEEYYDKNEDYISKEKLKGKFTKLTDIPLETLPCPKELQNVDESYGHPIQNEIRLKAFSKARCIAPSLIFLLLIILI